MSILPVCMHAIHFHFWRLWGVGEGAGFLGTAVITDGCEQLCECWELNPCQSSGMAASVLNH